MKIKGQILFYRIFDIAYEINLVAAEKALSILSAQRSLLTPKTFLVKNPPLQLSLGSETLTVGDHKYTVKLFAKIWDYGAVSIQFTYDYENLTHTELLAVTAGIERSSLLDKIAKERIKKIFDSIQDAITKGYIWDTFEDYTIFLLEDIGKKPATDLLSAETAQLLLIEDKEALSDSMVKKTLEGALQYGQNDLVLIDWNSAIVYDKNSGREISDIIEISTVHLLEARFYDEVLERKMANVYPLVGQNWVKKMFTNPLKRTATRYVEISEFMDRFDKSIKTIGDSYLATVFYSANKEFKISIWQNRIQDKRNVLFNIIETIQGEIHHSRAFILEFMIVVLFIYSVLPTTTK